MTKSLIQHDNQFWSDIETNLWGPLSMDLHRDLRYRIEKSAWVELSFMDAQDDGLLEALLHE